jgi:hypothetical protein
VTTVKKSINALILAGVASLSSLSLGCGDLATQGQSPVMLVIDSLTGNASGTLQSDVIATSGGIFNDTGAAVLRIIPKNPTGPTPTDINSVTINRYRITYRRSDGRNTPGVDVPYPFDSALTVRVPTGGTVTASFEFVRHTAKMEAPLAALANSAVIIATIADVSFFGRDQAGHEVAATGSIGVQFGNFADEK